ncbi:MAG: AAA-like domain-containing protein [Bacteroidaceae bacterium]|nr:AAA-like domain-containing protein [Bacteroidaceae bacterium]
MKTFNTAGTCRPNEHYMVDITERLEIIRKMVAKGDYFCINRGRQYGKTTTLEAVSNQLSDEYCIFQISFEGISDSTFADEEKLYSVFVWLLVQRFKWVSLKGLDEGVGNEIKSFYDAHKERCSEMELSDFISTICYRNTKPLVLLIDEVDLAGNFTSFLKFLGLLRGMYLKRNVVPAFQSVILAGVYDIKNLKLKIRTGEQHQYNSPWNIAVPFDVDMSLSAEGIAGMLAEYKADHNLMFDEAFVARMIRDYTSGYPFLVSRICQIIDAEQWTWDKDGVLKAVNKILTEGSTLFDDIAKKLDEFPELERTIRGILFNGYRYSFNYYDKATNLALMFNFVKQQDGTFAVASRMFEIWFYEYFISQDKNSADFIQGMTDKSQFIHDGILDIPLLMERFVVHMNQTYKMDHDNEFIENDARKVFLTYLRPVINGIGSYHIEEQTRDHDRMDVVIDYLGRQYVVELKIWRGNAYNERGEEQLCRYLEYFDLQQGYLLSFCFNKTKNSGLLPPVELKGRTLIEAIV